MQNFGSFAGEYGLFAIFGSVCFVSSLIQTLREERRLRRLVTEHFADLLRLPPPYIEMLEEKLKLPPLTLQSIRMVSEDFSKIRTVVNK